MFLNNRDFVWTKEKVIWQSPSLEGVEKINSGRRASGAEKAGQ